MSSWSRLKALLVAAVASAVFLTASASASAAGLVNGDFESGNLEGWTTYSAHGEGGWFPYAKEPGQGIFTPPSGNWAAYDEEGDPDTLILYQDFEVPPYSTSSVSLYLYYGSGAAIVVPSPNTLATQIPSFENQQVRVDVTKTSAPLDSLAPGDILATPFASKSGDPEEMGPTLVSADLSAYAGQTVRLRIANAVNDFYMETGVDGASITSTLINTFTHGKLTKKDGSATVAITVPGPGVLKLVSLGKKGKPKPIKAVTKHRAAPGKVKLTLKPTGWGKKQLEETGKLPFKVKLTYTPTGGTPTSQKLSGKLKG